MRVFDRLNIELSRQARADDRCNDDNEAMNRYNVIAAGYAEMENAIVVLSDLRRNVSHVHLGKYALNFSVEFQDGVIESIWENEILELVHPEDLERKYLQELRFYNFIKRQPKNQRRNHVLHTHIRMRFGNGEYVRALHRMFYMPAEHGSSQRFALCLYGPPPSGTGQGTVDGAVDTVTGRLTTLDNRDDGRILSRREREVLELVAKGESSKEIGEALCISVHTVNRHRQEILRKLQARNSHEACKAAQMLGLL